jgi:pilus assembly protein CpaC
MRAVLAFVLTVLFAATAANAQDPAARIPQVSITAGRSTVVTTTFDVTRIAITNPAIADAVVVKPREVLVDGKSAGTITLMVWGANERMQYDIVVEQPISSLEQQLHQLFPTEEVQVAINADGIVLSGRASSTQVMLRIAEVVRAAQPKANVINMLQVPGGSDAQQVMLQVRIAEVSRKTLSELGTSIFTGPTGAGDWIGRGTTGQFASVDFKDLERTVTPSAFDLKGKMEFSDFLNLFLFNTKWNAGALVRALKQTGHFQSLAEPNLIAYNGQEAGFLAGGEVPVPVLQGGNVGGISIEYKEFGVRLNFRPTIAGDTVRLKVRTEVSTLDFTNGILLTGFRIPALSTRRAETDVELRDGQSFAIAGLLNNLSQDDVNNIPGLSKIPIIGKLFQSKASRAERTELMVLITPRLVRALNPDEVPPLPTILERFLPSTDSIGSQLQGGGGTVDAPAVTKPAPAGPAPRK